MIVYVITKGDYSDYHICGVALDKGRAEIIRKLMTDKWDEANIEEYDTEKFSDVSDGESLYRVEYEYGAVTVENSLCEYDYSERNKVFETVHGYRCHVLAKDEEHAIKKALDLFAKYRYRKEVEENGKSD